MNESVISSEDRERVKKLIQNAFDTVPKHKQIANHDCDECQKLRQDYQNRNWQDLEAELVDAHAWDLPLLTHEAFRYFHPACIMRTIDEWGDPLDINYGSAHDLRFGLRSLIILNGTKKGIDLIDLNFMQSNQFLKLVRMEPMYDQFHAEADVGLTWYKAK